MVLNLILHIEIYSPEGFEKSAYISPDGQNFPIWHKKGSKERKFSSEIKMGVLGSPKSSNGTVMGIRRENGWAISPCLINILDNYKGLTNRLIIMD
ncbi:uncharacterized protein LOC132626132 isoform X2 [Lycium barbarum]|uniref:uncharacterized protein LOC132626132 isoform X2 n=1 Tax=Lycium barbarum TaxID=112863 RepID=UPI00293ED655|nr:uncharacterized protein LOC132626132 isoform X2 [Lycium barbarum]